MIDEEIAMTEIPARSSTVSAYGLLAHREDQSVSDLNLLCRGRLDRTKASREANNLTHDEPPPLR
jgi:thiamine pyrophosphokinase